MAQVSPSSRELEGRGASGVGNTTQTSPASEGATQQHLGQSRAYLLPMALAILVVGLGTLAEAFARRSRLAKTTRSALHATRDGKPAAGQPLSTTSAFEFTASQPATLPQAVWITQCAPDGESMYVWRTGSNEKARLAEFLYPQDVKSDCGPAHRGVYPLVSEYAFNRCAAGGRDCPVHRRRQTAHVSHQSRGHRSSRRRAPLIVKARPVRVRCRPAAGVNVLGSGAELVRVRLDGAYQVPACIGCQNDQKLDYYPLET